MFSPFLKIPMPNLPLRARLQDIGDWVPAQVLDALGYQDLLEVVLDYGEATLAQFRAVIDQGQQASRTICKAFRRGTVVTYAPRACSNPGSG